MGDTEASSLTSETPAKRQKLGENASEANSFEQSKFARYYRTEATEEDSSASNTSSVSFSTPPTSQYGYGYAYSTGYNQSYPSYNTTYSNAGYSYPYTQNQTTMAAYSIPNAQANMVNALQSQYSGDFAYNYTADQTGTAAYAAAYGYNPGVNMGTYGYNTTHNTLTPGITPLTQGYTDDSYSTAPSRVIHCRGVADGCKESDLIGVLQNFGNITYITLLPKIKQALVEFENIESAVSLHTYSQTQPLMVLGKQMYVNYSKSQEIKREKTRTGGSVEAPSNVLLLTIKNPLHQITVKVLYAISSPYGNVQRIVIFHKNGLQALVEYDSVESAQLAMMGLNGQDIYAGCCTLKVDFSRTRRLNVHKNDDETWDFSTGVQTSAASSLAPLTGTMQAATAATGVYSGYTDTATSAYYQGLAGNGQMAQNWTTAALNWQNSQAQVAASATQSLPQQDYSNTTTTTQQQQQQLPGLAGNTMLNQANVGAATTDNKDASAAEQLTAVANSAVGFPTVQSILSKAGAAPGGLQANPMLIQALIQQQQQKALLGNLQPGLLANHPLAKAVQAAQAAQALQLAQAAQLVQAQVRQAEAKKVGLLGNSPFPGSTTSTPTTNPTTPAVPSLPGAMGLLKPPAGLTPVQQATLLANMGRGAMINQALLGKKPVVGMLPGLFQNPGTFSNPAAAKMAAAAAAAAVAQKNMANSGVPNCVVMVYGINLNVFNCDKLFNIFCLYGNVLKVKFLLNKNGVAMVQMADRMAADMIIKHYSGQLVFDSKLHMIYSKHPYIGDISSGGSFGDGTPTAMNYTDSPKNRFKFAGDSGNLKNRQAPCKMLHFFNAPPTCSIDDLQKVLNDAGAQAPLRGTFFAGKATGKSSSGLLEMETVSSAIEAVALCNHTMYTTEGGTFTIKLAFSPSSSIPPTALTSAPSTIPAEAEKQAYMSSETQQEEDVCKSSLLGASPSTGGGTSILGNPPRLSSSGSLFGAPPNSTVGSLLGAPPLGAPPISGAPGYHAETGRGGSLLGDPPILGEGSGNGAGELGRKSLLGDPPAMGSTLPGPGTDPSAGILGESPEAMAAKEAIVTLVSMSQLPSNNLPGYSHGTAHT